VSADGEEAKEAKEARRSGRQEKGERKENAISRLTALGLHMTEDVIYALTALVLVGGAFIVLGAAVYDLGSQLPEGVTKAIEKTLNSLLIVFILVELLSAVRSAIDEHTLVAEPFLLVGILASIKETVVLATFKIDEAKAGETALKIGVLGGVVVALAVATLVLRRREREPKESGDT
jgi:uncharacterized membrane protein (DUF373 family)